MVGYGNLLGEYHILIDGTRTISRSIDVHFLQDPRTITQELYVLARFRIELEPTLSTPIVQQGASESRDKRVYPAEERMEPAEERLESALKGGELIEEEVESAMGKVESVNGEVELGSRKPGDSPLDSTDEDFGSSKEVYPNEGRPKRMAAEIGARKSKDQILAKRRYRVNEN
jgi:hypothetical protein